MRAALRTLFVGLLLVMYPFCQALEVTRTTYGIALSGRIEDGDSEKVVRELLRPSEQTSQDIAEIAPEYRFLFGPYKGAAEFDIQSVGGSLQEALQIAALIKALHANVTVGRHSRKPLREVVCASACFFVFLAGKERIASGFDERPPEWGRVGLHRPYFNANATADKSSEEIALRQRSLMSKVREYLISEQVSQRLIDMMMSRSSRDVYWLTQNDLRELGSFRPEYEELTVARCGFDAAQFLDVVHAAHSKDGSATPQVRKLYKSYLTCRLRLFSQVPVLEQLSKGWRPKVFE